MRLFVAVPIPPEVKEQLVERQQPIEGVRWEARNKLHLTLKFLGDTDPKQAHRLGTKLNNIAQPAFSISIKGVGYFPEGQHPKVLWAGIRQSKQLTRLKNSVEEVCVEMGFEPDSRPFKPHITLGRNKGAPKRDVMSFINQHKQLRIPEVKVQQFVLYESKLDTTGAKHSRLKTCTLGSLDQK